jgi:hypothetical protein
VLTSVLNHNQYWFSGLLIGCRRGLFSTRPDTCSSASSTMTHRSSCCNMRRYILNSNGRAPGEFAFLRTDSQIKGRPDRWFSANNYLTSNGRLTPCIIGYGSSPSRCGPGSLETARSDTRPLRFRPAPFMRDGVFDLDGASAPGIAAPPILPSALGDVLGLRDHKTFAAQYPTPHNRCVRFVAAIADGPRNTRYRAVASLTRTGLPPAGSDQLILTHPPRSGRSLGTMPCGDWAGDELGHWVMPPR